MVRNLTFWSTGNYSETIYPFGVMHIGNREEEKAMVESRNAFARAFLKTLQAHQLERSLDEYPEIFAMARAFILSTSYGDLYGENIRPKKGINPFDDEEE